MQQSDDVAAQRMVEETAALQAHIAHGQPCLDDNNSASDNVSDALLKTPHAVELICLRSEVAGNYFKILGQQSVVNFLQMSCPDREQQIGFAARLVQRGITWATGERDCLSR